MKKTNHTCKICGEKYYACDYCEQEHTFTPWRSVCCSIECYKEYLKLITDARNETISEPQEDSKVEIVNKTASKITNKTK